MGGDFSIYTPRHPRRRPQESSNGGASNMGLSSVANSRNAPRREQGSLGLTKLGGKVIRSACAFQEERYRRGTMSLVTLTIPSDKPDDIALCGLMWSELMHRFIEELRRELTRKGLPAEVIYVNELQKRGALHAHLTFKGRHDYEGWALTPGKIDSLWKIALGKIGLKVDSVASACKVERVKKSLVGYLSKYMSKGNKALAVFKEAGLDVVIPPSWWGCTRTLRKEVDRRRTRLTGITTSAFTWDRALAAVSEVQGIIFAGLHTTDEGFLTGLYGRGTPESLKRIELAYVLL